MQRSGDVSLTGQRINVRKRVKPSVAGGLGPAMALDASPGCETCKGSTASAEALNVPPRASTARCADVTDGAVDQADATAANGVSTDNGANFDKEACSSR